MKLIPMKCDVCGDVASNDADEENCTELWGSLVLPSGQSYDVCAKCLAAIIHAE